MAMFFALGAILLWSTLALLGLKLNSIPPFLLLAGAFILGGLPSLWNRKAWQISWQTYLVGIGGIFGYHFLYFRAFAIAPAVEVNLINYLWPLLIVVLSPVILKDSALTPRHIIAAFLGLVGSAIIVSGGTLHLNARYLGGYAAAFCAAIIWALYSLFSKRLPKFSTASVSVFCLISGIISLAAFLLSGGSDFDFRRLPMSTWVTLAAIGVGPMGAAFYLWDAALKNGDPRKIGILSYLTPLLSTINLAIFARQQITPLILISMALIIAGSIIGISGSTSSKSGASVNEQVV